MVNLRPTVPHSSDFVVVCSWQHHTDAWYPPEPKKQPAIGLTVISKTRLKRLEEVEEAEILFSVVISKVF